jgi:Fe-S-cluster containining protein
MVKCKNCGECCRWFPITMVREELPTEVREYCETRADKIDEGFYVLHAPCQHLKTLKSGQTRCAIYKTRPTVCKAYLGKQKQGNKTYYVPKSCALRKEE